MPPEDVASSLAGVRKKRRRTKGDRQVSSIVPPVRDRNPGILNAILVARKSPVCVSTLHKQKLQQQPGGETANVAPPGDTPNISLTREGKSAARHLGECPESQVNHRR